MKIEWSKLPRLEGWAHRLVIELESRRERPPRLGVHDCTAFAAACVWLIVGRDPLAPFRATLADHAAATQTLETFGGLARAAQFVFGRPSSAAQLYRGDVGLVIVDGFQALGVVTAQRLAVAHHPAPGAPAGLLWFPRSAVHLGWQIGRR